MDPKKKAVILGALLHDIGKVGQRAYKKGELSKATLDREGDICPGDKFSTHLHVLWTDEFFSSCFTDELSNKVVGELSFDTNPQNLASFHHKPTSSLHRLIQIADHISSGEREETERGEKEDYIKRRLSSIFNKIALKGEPKIAEQYFYDLTPLSIEKSVFPKIKNQLDPPAGTSEIEKYRLGYVRLWGGFIKDFNNLRDKTIDLDLNFSLFLSGLYHLLMRYTWCVPSYTNAKNEVDDDISLFDHSRSTAAIASCLYDIYGSEEVPAKATEPEFMLIEGDISGIQNFLYKMSRPSGIQGVGRILRGRSMFLTLLPIVTANYITRELDQAFVNILYAGGGNFQVLLPNKKESINNLKQVANEIDRWLFTTFRGELGLVLGHVEANRHDLGQGYGDVISNLKSELENQKSRKFFNTLFEDWNYVIKQEDKICNVCGSLDAVTNDSICSTCENHRKLGETIPKSDYLALSKKRDFRRGLKIEFGIMGDMWFLEYAVDESELKDIDFYWRINSADSVFGFKFLGSQVPKATEFIGSEILSNEGFDINEYREGDTISFDHLDLLATGDKKLGVLRMDVDYLGLIFSLGITQVTNDWATKGTSISRMATLSRMLDWFFTGYLNTLCNLVSFNLSEEANEQLVKNLRKRVENHFYIVYSGGDDLFVVGPWDEAVELMFWIQKDLKEFTGYNGDIDISGGLSIVKAKFPISRSGELAEEELDGRAKKERGSLSAFGEVGTWDAIGKSLEFGKILEKAINGTNGKKLPRSFLNRVLQVRSDIVNFEPDDPRRLLQLPELVYSLSRNIDEKLKINWKGRDTWIKKQLWDELIKNDTGLKNSGFGVKYALLKTRRR